MEKIKIIHRALGITFLSYENCRDTHFNMWCNKYAVLYALPLKAMVSNDHIYNWFCQVWQHQVETPFCKDNRAYIEAKVNDPHNFQDLFLQYTDVVMNYYPNALLLDLKQQHKSQQLNEQ